MTASRKVDWLVPTLLILLGLVPVAAGMVRIGQLLSGGEITPENARFFAAPLPVLMHLLAAVPFGIVGAFQFSRSIRKRHGTWHRTAGALLIPLGLVTAFTGLWMAHYYPWPDGDGVALYWLRIVFGSAMALSITLGVRAILRGDHVMHGAWMTRAYAIAMGAGTQVFTHLPWFIFIGGQPGELPRAILMGAGWVINLMVAEVVISRRCPRAHQNAGSNAQALMLPHPPPRTPPRSPPRR